MNYVAHADVATYLFLGSQIGLIEDLAVQHQDGDFIFVSSTVIRNSSKGFIREV